MSNEKLVDDLIHAVASVHDGTTPNGLWSHLRRDKEPFRTEVRKVLEDYTDEKVVELCRKLHQEQSNHKLDIEAQVKMRKRDWNMRGEEVAAETIKSHEAHIDMLKNELSSIHERGKAAWEKTAAERDSWVNKYHEEANEVVRLKLVIHNLLKDNTLKDFARSETERAESNGERASYFEVENMKLSAEIKEWKEKAQMFNKVGMDKQSEAVGAQLECCSLRNDVGRLERERAMLRDRCNTAEARRVEAEVERDDALTVVKKN